MNMFVLCDVCIFATKNYLSYKLGAKYTWAIFQKSKYYLIWNIVAILTYFSSSIRDKSIPSLKIYCL